LDDLRTTLARLATGTQQRLGELLPAKQERSSALVAIQGQGSQLPLFLVHPAGGSVLGYGPLAHLLGPDQPVYGFEAHGVGARHLGIPLRKSTLARVPARKRVSFVLKRAVKAGLVADGTTPGDFARQVRFFQLHSDAVARYAPEPYDARVILFRAAESYADSA